MIVWFKCLVRSGSSTLTTDILQTACQDTDVSSKGLIYSDILLALVPGELWKSVECVVWTVDLFHTLLANAETLQLFSQRLVSVLSDINRKVLKHWD